MSSLWPRLHRCDRRASTAECRMINPDGKQRTGCIYWMYLLVNTQWTGLKLLQHAAGLVAVLSLCPCLCGTATQRCPEVCPRLLFVPTWGVSRLYVGFMNPAEKQSLAGFNPGNIFKLRLARRCLLRLACCCFPHAASQSSPPVLFILLRYLSGDIYFFFIILPAKKKSMANYNRRFIEFIPRFAPLLAFKNKMKYNSTLSNAQPSWQLRRQNFMRSVASHKRQRGKETPV